MFFRLLLVAIIVAFNSYFCHSFWINNTTSNYLVLVASVHLFNWPHIRKAEIVVWYVVFCIVIGILSLFTGTLYYFRTKEA